MIKFKQFLFQEEIHYNPTTEKIKDVARNSTAKAARFTIDHDTGKMAVGDAASPNDLHDYMSDRLPHDRTQGFIIHHGENDFTHFTQNRPPTKPSIMKFHDTITKGGIKDNGDREPPDEFTNNIAY